MGEVEFKALGPFYGDGDETIKIGERKTFSNSYSISQNNPFIDNTETDCQNELFVSKSNSSIQEKFITSFLCLYSRYIDIDLFCF